MTSIAPQSALVSAAQGLQSASNLLNQTAQKVASGPDADGDPSTAVGLIQSKTAFDANLAVLQTVNQTQKRLLDIKV
jgi:hypothetical protein